MPPDVAQTLALTLVVDDQPLRQVPIRSSRFFIGSDPDNDLVVVNKGVERRHAVIESINNAVQVSDCGSRLGLQVNGRRISGVVALHNGDTISIGDECRMVIRMQHQAAGIALRPAPEGSDNRTPGAVRRRAKPRRGRGRSAYRISPSAAAAAAAILIVLGALAIIVIFNLPSTKISAGAENPPPANNKSATAAAPIAEPEPPPEPSVSGDVAIDRLEADAARQVMLQISSDTQPYVFPSQAWSDIKRRVDECGKSRFLAASLQTMRQRLRASSAPRSRSAVETSIALYAGLARTAGGETGDPVAVAERMQPDIQYLRITFGDGTAEGSLMLVAALAMGREHTRWHPLLNALRKTDRVTDRNIWYLHQIGELDERTYSFVVSFLAFAIIAQEPRQFQVDADPILFPGRNQQ